MENSVQWKMFGPKREEVTRNWKKSHNAELHDLCCSAYTGGGMWPEWETQGATPP